MNQIAHIKYFKDDRGLRISLILDENMENPGKSGKSETRIAISTKNPTIPLFHSNEVGN